MASKLEEFDDVAIWPPQVETFFITLLVKESKKGLHTSTLDRKTWKAIDTDMFSKFGRRYAIPKLKSKFNRLRKMHREFSNILSQTGAHYDPETNVIHVDDDVWEAYLKKHPAAKRYRRKGCAHYDMLDEIFKTLTSTNRPPPYAATHSQSNSEDEQRVDEPETGADDFEPNANIADTNESGTSATAVRHQAIRPLENVWPTKQPRSSEHLGVDNTHGAWTNNVSSKIEATLGQIDRFHKNSEILSSGFDPYSVTECMDKLESIPNVANASYFKAMERFLIPEWRQMFIKMSEGRRCMWLESLKN
ncbi:L10-interacting MYB domain-containing protein-like [Humulus lupulus]|uniref:L10-interacting MYB domain-containing protein-like n=1 Tax=Humulus lupulus TaxID=3486 RepID=UPI002B41493F|nr:L10-interacting MYB domain-containing protein-like [Humulus lupulus]XP_062082797.1 L10-interacting MYB domain-containing protein-like [Humulus lupulus]